MRRPPSQMEENIATEMCRADGLDPYNYVAHSADDGAAMQGPQWWAYVRAARQFLAGLRAIGTV
jgi:hypothetical protein